MLRQSFLIGLVGFVSIMSLLMLMKSTCTRGEVKKMLGIIKNPSDIVALFPKSVEELEKGVDQSIADAQKRIDAIVAVPNEQRTFANTVKELDVLESQSNLVVMGNLAEIINVTDPDEQMRNAGQSGLIKIEKFSTDNISNNPELYKAFKEYVDGNAQKEKLSDEERYFIDERMKEFKRNGLHLPAEQLEEVKKLKKRLTELALQFEKNINDDESAITVKREELAGLPDDFINVLKRTDDGLYILGVDYPTFFTVIDHCDVTSTRQQLYKTFQNRAYPVNEAILKEIIQLRDELAKKLGFESYSHLDLDDQMAKTPVRAQKFLDELLEKVQVKEAQEFKKFTADLPKSVTLSPEGKMYPWNARYTIEQYKKKHFDIDENKVAEYFPMEKTVEGLLDIYQQFLGLKFNQVPISGLWHDDVRLIEARDSATNQLLGYLLLDLYPRPNKYSHACHAGIIPSVKGDDDSKNPALSLMIANFPKSTPTKPSLLKRNDVETFFHEFGHAMHSLLGRTSLGSFAGTHTKTDFVEVPSQMLEEWLWDKDILKLVSSHYKTGESLSDDLIDKMIAAKKLSKGWQTQRQIFLSRMSLDYFKEGAIKDVYKMMHNLHTQICLHQLLDSEDHKYASFGHLTGYGSKYYSYLWSKVFALDLFDEIKKHGLLNPEIGKRLITEVLGKGGSKEPHELLVAFLGREPNQKAFLKDMGLDSINE